MWRDSQRNKEWEKAGAQGCRAQMHHETQEKTWNQRWLGRYRWFHYSSRLLGWRLTLLLRSYNLLDSLYFKWITQVIIPSSFLFCLSKDREIFQWRKPFMMSSVFSSAFTLHTNGWVFPMAFISLLHKYAYLKCLVLSIWGNIIHIYIWIFQCGSVEWRSDEPVHCCWVKNVFYD